VSKNRRRSTCLTLILLISLAFQNQSAFAKPSRDNDVSTNPSKCRPQALVTADNDMRLNGDDRPPGKPAAIPTVVITRLQNAANRLISQFPPGTTEGLACNDLSPQTYRISLPDGRHLFIAEIYVGLGIGYFYLIVHDPRTGTATINPPRIAATSSQDFGAGDPLIKKPLVSFTDLFGNHHPQIVLEERVHNGTMYNAVIYHYFDVGPDLALTRVLARETRLMALEPEGAIYIRELTHLSPTRLRMDTFELPGPHSAQRKEMGYAILESSGPGVPFHVAQRFPKDPKSFDCLVTCQVEPPADDVFLREGNTFRY
jgi:hypothetical protein